MWGCAPLREIVRGCVGQVDSTGSVLGDVVVLRGPFSTLY